MKFLRDFEVRAKRVLVRADFNGHLENGRLVDDFKIRAALPTIEYLIRQKAKIILASHLGRPNGKVVAELRLNSVGRRISQLLNRPIKQIDDCIGKEAEKAVSEIKSGEIILLENVQFHPGEKKKSKKYIEALAKLADIFVLDAFGQAHRDYASISGLSNALPSCAGLLLEKEIQELSAAMEKPQKPLVVILGGAKISDKLCLIKNFLKKTDYFLLGGGIANSFAAARDLPVGDSLYDEKSIPTAKKLLKEQSIFLPLDSVVWQRRILDIGDETIKKYEVIIRQAKTIIWNGPLGYAEDKRFCLGTHRIAAEILRNQQAKIIIGGGETVAVFQTVAVDPQISNPNIFLSTGGGAMLEFLAGKKLPGIEALGKKV